MKNTLIGGRFRLGESVGAGGMGVVWQAEDIRMQRRVAVKLVFPDHSHTDAGEIRIRFKREVQSAGRLSHRNIVTVHDWGEATLDGREALFLVMELVDGVPLSQRLKTEMAAPPWQQAAAWALQIAQALAAVHGAGVVHRDIKPGNVLLTSDGTVKLLDFGIARLVGDTLRVNGLTHTGVPLGTAGYMSPEQAIGRPDAVDHRSDLYSLGCLLYHTVTGRPPFLSDNVIGLMFQHVQDRPMPPDELVPEIPRPLADLILTLLAKEPGHRPVDASAVQDVLETILLDHALLEPWDPDWSEAPLPGPLSGELAMRLLQRAREIEDEAYCLLADADSDRDAAGQLREEAERALHEARRLRGQRIAEQAQTDRHVLETRTRAEADAAWTVRRAREEAEREAARLTGEAETEALGVVADARAEAASVLRRARLDAQRERAEIIRRAREEAESEAGGIVRSAQTEAAWIAHEAVRDRRVPPDHKAREMEAAWSGAEAAVHLDDLLRVVVPEGTSRPAEPGRPYGPASHVLFGAPPAASSGHTKIPRSR